MDSTATLKSNLVRLQCTGILETIDERSRQAIDARWSPTEFLTKLLDDELTTRNNRKLERRLHKSHLDPTQTIETFDFSVSSAHEPTIRELALGRFMAQHENILIVGPCGVGKSHLAQAIGHQVCRKGSHVLYQRTDHLLQHIHTPPTEKMRTKRLQKTINTDLLILDDFGLLPLSEPQQNTLYEIICQRYQKRSTIITSNRHFPEWLTVFNNPLIGSAALDRIQHHAIRLTLQGESHRKREFVRRNTPLMPQPANQ
jgi:DNA replication protein DnaC